MPRASLGLCGLLALVLLVAGCGGADADTPAAADRPTIGVSVLTLTHSFFQDLSEALEAEADARGFDIVLTAADFDVAKQRNQISDFVVQDVDAIILSPADSRAIGTAIQEANAAGIPVFTADIAALADDVDIVTHIATNNYEGGRLAAEAVVEAIGRQGEVAILDHPTVESVMERTRGFREGIEATNEEGGDLEIVAVLPSGGAKDQGFRAAEDILQAHPGLDAFFAINDEAAMGAVAAIEKAGLEGQVQVVGFDGAPEAKQAIRDGKVYASVVQHPRQIGAQSAAAVDDYLAGETLPEVTLIPATLYRQSDALEDPTLDAAASD